MMEIQIQRLEIFVFRVPLEKPVITSFGAMGERPAVLVRISSDCGAFGWGEVWCNFPACGAEHRARVLETVIAPMLWGRKFKHPAQVFEFLTDKTRVLALQSGEAGPLAQAIAGVDIAVWDMVSRRNNRTLQNLLADRGIPDVPAYASGIAPLDAAESITHCRDVYGHKAFKVKVGFGAENDLAAISAARESLREGDRLMLDANQAWNLDDALEVLACIEDLAPDWMEEPLAADAPRSQWRALGEATNIAIAGGENIRGTQEFRNIIDASVFDVIQPDACKWGGITGCLKVAQWALEAGLRYCPHYLGAGIGLVASAHILAAAGGDGLLEIDINPNPLREALAQPFPKIANGRFSMPVDSGLGVAPDLSAVKPWLTQRHDLMA